MSPTHGTDVQTCCWVRRYRQNAHDAYDDVQTLHVAAHVVSYASTQHSITASDMQPLPSMTALGRSAVQGPAIGMRRLSQCYKNSTKLWLLHQAISRQGTLVYALLAFSHARYRPPQLFKCKAGTLHIVYSSHNSGLYTTQKTLGAYLKAPAARPVRPPLKQTCRCQNHEPPHYRRTCQETPT